MPPELPSADLSKLSTDGLLEHLKTLGDIAKADIAGKLIVELAGRGESLNRIAELTGIPRSTVSLWSRQAKGGAE